MATQKTFPLVKCSAVTVLPPGDESETDGEVMDMLEITVPNDAGMPQMFSFECDSGTLTDFVFDADVHSHLLNQGDCSRMR